METTTLMQWQGTLGFVGTASAFALLTWSAVVLKYRRGYIYPALAWIGNAFLYYLVWLLGVDSFGGNDLLPLWAEVIRFQGAITVLFISAWMIAEGLSFFHRGGHPA